MRQNQKNTLLYHKGKVIKKKRQSIWKRCHWWEFISKTAHIPPQQSTNNPMKKHPEDLTGISPQKKYKRAKRHMKGISRSLSISTTIIKYSTNNKCSWGSFNASPTLAGDGNIYSHYGKQKTEHVLVIWPNNPTPGHISRQNSNPER